jgi:hypothetical protein
MFLARSDGLCPRCAKAEPIERWISPYYLPAGNLARKLDTELPAPLCEACLLEWRAHVDRLQLQELERDQELWQRCRDGSLSVDDFLQQARDRETYRKGAEAIRERQQAAANKQAKGAI